MKFYIYIKQVYQAAAKNFPPRPRHNISLKQSESVFNSNSVTGVTANIRSLVLTVSTQFYWMEGGYWWCHWCFCKYMFLGSYFLILLHTSAQFNWGKWKGNKRMTGSKEGWILGVSQGKAGWLVACLSSWGKTTRRGNNEENYFGRFRSDRENYNLHIIIV